MHRSGLLSELALARPVTIGTLLASIFVLGLISLWKLPLAFLPTETTTRAYVRVSITRTSPEVLERDVIRPLEEQIAGIRGLTKIQVGSGSWGVRVNLEFRPGSDPDTAKLELRERIERVRGTLPDVVQRIEIGSHSNNDDPVMSLRIAGAGDLTREYYLIERHVVRPIERIPGVARVELEGVTPHEMEVAADLLAASRSGVALADVGTVVRGAQRGRSLGVLHGPERSPGVRTPAEPAEPRTFAELPLRRGTGVAGFARLEEVADVSVHPEEQRGGGRLDGRPAVTLNVFTSAGASVVDVSRGVHEAMGAMHENPALHGIDVVTSQDQGKVILQTLGDLRDTGIWGGLLGIAVLYGFLRNAAITAVAAMSIPVSVLAACAVLFLNGDEINCIVLLGLVLGVGMLIDNAIVIVEAIAHEQARVPNRLEAARRGARRVALATVASTVSTVIVFLPLLLGSPANPMTAYLNPLGMTFSIALLCSLFVSQTSVPLLLGHVVRLRPAPARHSRFEAVTAAYGRLLAATLRRPRLSLLLGLALAATTAVPLRGINYDLREIQESDDGLRIRLQMTGSRDHVLVRSKVEAMEAAVLPRKDELGIDAFSCSYRDHGGNCIVYPASPFGSEQDREAFQARISAVLPEQPGVTYRYGERDFSWAEGRDRREVEFALKGEDMAVLMELAERAVEHLRGNLTRGDAESPEAGGYDVIDSPFSEGAEELHVELLPERLQRYGLTASEVADRIALAFQGVPLGRIQGPDGELGLRLSAGDLGGPDGPGQAGLRDLKLPTPAGLEVPLSSVAEFTVVRAPWWIQRVDRQTEVRVKVRFFSRDAGANWQAVEQAMASFDFPEGYSWGRGTEWSRQRDSGAEMLVNLGLCLLLVYAVMASLFESFVQPFSILAICLFGCFGAPWGMYLTDSTVDTVAIIGVFILIGVVVNNGIMLVDRVTQLRLGGVPRTEALLLAGRDRLRPILMTVTTTVLGLVPMLIHHPTLAGVYYHSIAIIVTSGLVTSTLATLVFLPAAYTLIEDVTVAIRGRFRAIARGRR